VTQLLADVFRKDPRTMVVEIDEQGRPPFRIRQSLRSDMNISPHPEEPKWAFNRCAFLHFGT
jgi:hypothetical protein